MTSFLSSYFDTETGSKKEADSYRKFAQTINMSPDRILFISDVIMELRAAQFAGMQTLFCLKPGNHSLDSEGFELIKSFDIV